jgi:hypothetical protein
MSTVFILSLKDDKAFGDVDVRACFFHNGKDS